jgi:hypothetical protein
MFSDKKGIAEISDNKLIRESYITSVQISKD